MTQDKKPRILIIDDEPLSTKTLTSILQLKGLEVKSTAFAKQALEWLKEGFDMVLLDLKLPDMKGIEVLRIIKRDYPHIVVIVITAYASVETAVSIMEEGAYTYVTKPFDIDALINTINKAWKEKRIDNKKDKLLVNLSLIYQIGKEMEGVIELHSISMLAARYLAGVVSLDVCAVLLKTEGKKEFSFGALHGVKYNICELAQKRFKLEGRIYERLIKEKHSLLIPELKTRPEILSYIPLKDPKCLFIFPMISNDTVVGLAMLVGLQAVTLDDNILETVTTISNEIALCIENANRYLKLKQNYMGAVGTLVKAIEDKGEFQKGHSKAVADLSVVIARNMNLSKEDVELIRFAGLVHDIGKIAISEQILFKKEKLSAEEYLQLKMHSVISTSIIRSLDEDKKVIPIILYHHERYDGSGYPEGLKGDIIPIGARIMAVCDAYEAMTSPRPYRKEISTHEAIEELQRCGGMQFDPEVVKVFVEVFNKGYIS